MIGIIGALDLETETLIRDMQQKEEREISGIRFVEGYWQARKTVVATSGVGKVFAALCAEAMILSYRPEVIINSGIAGALDPRLHILNVAVANSVVQHDIDTCAFGDPPGLIPGIEQVELPTDRRLAAAFENAARALGVPVTSGVVASGDQFIADQRRKEEIRRVFGAVCCEMEGAAIGQVCRINRVPFAVLRTISDEAEDRAKLDYPAFAAAAAEQGYQILKKAWEELAQ